MPEGPEIRRAAQAVHRAVAGQPLRMTLAHPTLAPMERALRGAVVESVRARSKAMLTCFSTGDVLYSHNQLYGEWVVDRPDEPLLARAIRLVLDTGAQRAVLYSATDLAWLRRGEESRHPYLARLGPEVLDEAVGVREIAARLALFPRRRLADALLDQHVLAGLGNYLRSEIAFVARLDPWRRLGELSDAERHRLASAVQQITHRSFRTDGVCVPTALYRAERKAGASYEAARFHVFDRAQQPCRACGATIERGTLGGRKLFVCVACQSVFPLPPELRN
jgi:endonuclease VIII